MIANRSESSFRLFGCHIHVTRSYK
jgi:hypothetical protein